MPEASGTTPPDTVVPAAPAGDRRPPGPPPAPGWFSRLWSLRRPIAVWQQIFWGALCVASVWAIWWFVTAPLFDGARLMPAQTLPSPGETFAKFHELWFEIGLTRKTWASLGRVALGFLLAAAIGIPLGVLCGSFTWAHAFFTPLTLFGRNIPIAALVPITFALFGDDELQKVMFIFIACVAFVISDTANAVAGIEQRYIDTAYTLGASRWQIIRKVLFPLALPDVFDSLRLLFGLAFGYIMLVEVIQKSESASGLGSIMNTAQRLGKREYIYLILITIPIVAYGVDRLLYWMQRELFPHRYGGSGYLQQLSIWALRRGEDLRSLFIKPMSMAELESAALAGRPDLIRAAEDAKMAAAIRHAGPARSAPPPGAVPPGDKP